MLNIHGYGDDLTVNNIRIGNLSPEEHAGAVYGMAWEPYAAKSTRPPCLCGASLDNRMAARRP